MPAGIAFPDKRDGSISDIIMSIFTHLLALTGTLRGGSSIIPHNLALEWEKA